MDQRWKKKPAAELFIAPKTDGPINIRPSLSGNVNHGAGA